MGTGEFGTKIKDEIGDKNYQKFENNMGCFHSVEWRMWHRKWKNGPPGQFGLVEPIVAFPSNLSTLYRVDGVDVTQETERN